MLKNIVKYSINLSDIKSTEYSDVKSPYNGDVVASIAQADEKVLDKALTAAEKTFKTTMSRMPAYKRAEILNKVCELIKEDTESFAKTIAAEGSKPIKDARVEVARCINTFSIAARETMSLDGEQIAMDSNPGGENRIGMIVRQPIGVVGAITPFNFPLNLVAHKVAPALAAGNCVVLKPSSQTPIASFKLAEALQKAGLPEGAFVVVPCRGSKANFLVKDPRIACLTFTGSPEIGWNLRAEVHPGTRVILELGGNAGVIVHEDADLDKAVQAALRGGYAHAGQVCISVQRVYVHEKIYDRFLKEFKVKLEKLVVGDPLDEKVDVGPMIDVGAAKQTLEWVDEAVSGGAKKECGGKHKDNLVDPILLTETKPDMKVVCKEVFGPVVSVMKYKNFDDAIEAINNTRYGLQAGVFTKDINLAFKAARAIDVGGVMVNDAPTFRSDHMPYGGRKESGLGLEGVRYALQEMTQPKFICLNLETD